MSQHILQTMLQKINITVVNKNGFSDFVARANNAVVFFAENPERYPETADVACVLPEILKAFPTLEAALVSEPDQHELQRGFDFTKWPTLAFFHRGNYRGAISGIRNWDEYQQLIPTLLEGNSTQAIPVLNL
ncbi:hydrogenase-1 operon protein HyaE [Alteromonadaceae bacterium 2753L.S.0a.02]|nr:hydrogenase-1 operon protein HyaE [Alteromonadaceae bacterium 2753L.S.0a.02]